MSNAPTSAHAFMIFSFTSYGTEPSARIRIRNRGFALISVSIRSLMSSISFEIGSEPNRVTHRVLQ